MGVIDETTQDDDEEEEESEKRNRLLKRRKLRRKLRETLVPTTAPVDLTRTRLPVTEAAVTTSLMSPSRWAGLKSRRRLLGGTATARAVAKNGVGRRKGGRREVGRGLAAAMKMTATTRSPRRRKELVEVVARTVTQLRSSYQKSLQTLLEEMRCRGTRLSRECGPTLKTISCKIPRISSLSSVTRS